MPLFLVEYSFELMAREESYVMPKMSSKYLKMLLTDEWLDLMSVFVAHEVDLNLII